MQDMLIGCDTAVALPNSTRHGQTIFGKNSDRQSEECQPLVQRERQSHPRGSVTRCQFVTLPEVATTWRHVGSRPYWCWGYEHGFNEHQVVIGNEGLASKNPEWQEHKLIGMEIIRLGLERGRTAAEAVEVMTGLISKHGQGKFKNAPNVRTYDNGYIVADPREAYVIETAGHEWVVKKVDSALGISNVHSVGTDWVKLSPGAERYAVEKGWWQPGSGRFDFAKAYCNYENRAPGRGIQRWACLCGVTGKFKGQITAQTMMSLLSDHSDGVAPDEPFQTEISPTLTVCVHHTEERKGNTAASLVADLCADGSRLPVYWCSMYSPCLGIFLPMFIEGQVPPVLAVGGETPSDDSPWWLFYKLDHIVRQDASGDAVRAVRTAWKGFQEELLESAYPLAERARRMMDSGQGEAATRLLTDYMARNVERALATVKKMLVTGPLAAVRV